MSDAPWKTMSGEELEAAERQLQEKANQYEPAVQDQVVHGAKQTATRASLAALIQPTKENQTAATKAQKELERLAEVREMAGDQLQAIEKALEEVRVELRQRRAVDRQTRQRIAAGELEKSLAAKSDVVGAAFLEAAAWCALGGGGATDPLQILSTLERFCGVETGDIFRRSRAAATEALAAAVPSKPSTIKKLEAPPCP